MQHDFQSVYDQLHAVETDCDAEEEAHQEQLVTRYHSRCPLAFQPEADQLDQEHRARLYRFQEEERESGSCVLPAEVTRALKFLETNLPSAIVHRRQELPRVRLYHLLLPQSIILRRTRAQTLESPSNCSHSYPPARALPSKQLPRSAFDLRRPSTVGPRPERPRTI